MIRNCIKKTCIFIVAFLIGSSNILPSTLLKLISRGAPCQTPNQLFAAEMTIGGKEGWPQFLYSSNVTTGKGRFGYESIEVATNSFKQDEYTDLLIDFEDPVMPISAGDYRVVKNNLRQTDKTINDKYAGLSRNTGGLVVEGNPGTFFGSEGLNGSFTIEFWLCPSISENGETILEWDTSKNVNNRLEYQAMSLFFNRGSLEWNLLNFFDSAAIPGIEKSITLKGTSKIIPDKWSNHVLSYDCETGILEYIVDGITEDLKYITSTGDESGDIALVLLGVPAKLKIGSEYTGKIDDIRISRRPYALPGFQDAEHAGKIGHVQYLPEGGYFVTNPIMTSKGAVLKSLKAEMDEPQQTEISYYVRAGDNYFGWTDTYPQWKPVESGDDINNTNGLYFQIAAELFPDGAGEITPSITEITLSYEEIPEPLPPFKLKAKAGNGTVTVSWDYSVDDTVGGYYLYYGNRPGEYLGRVAIEGASPINVGNKSSYTVTGLENGKIYYFAVAAYSVYDEEIIGNLSKEVFARPLARLK